MSIADDWTLDSIHQRDIQISDCIINILQKWNEEYLTDAPEQESDIPTQEDLDKIAEFKRKGWI